MIFDAFTFELVKYEKHTINTFHCLQFQLFSARKCKEQK